MEQNTIVTEPASGLRRMARTELSGRWKTAILAYILLSFLTYVPTTLIELLFGGGVDAFAGYDITRTQTMVMLYLMIVNGPLILGFSVFLLALIRGAKHGPGMILDGFNNFFRAFGLFLLFSVFVFLWSLLLVIPGIIAAFAYSQAFFLLADNPRIGLGHALKQSRRLMIGNKWKFFCLGISFFGWFCLTFLALLAMISFALFALSLRGIAFESRDVFTLFSDYSVTILSQIFSVVAIVMLAPVYVYVSTAQAIFHDILTGRRRLFPVREGFIAAAVGGGAERFEAGEAGPVGGEARRPETGERGGDGAPGGNDRDAGPE